MSTYGSYIYIHISLIVLITLLDISCTGSSVNFYCFFLGVPACSDTCFMSTGIAISPTLQGLTDYKTGTWEFIGDIDQYIVLEFTDFDISCDSFFYVAHTGSSARVEYCNKRKPVYPIVSTVHQLEMGFTYETCSTTHKALQGFKARFHVKSRGHKERQLVTSEQTGRFVCHVLFIFISFHFLIFVLFC